jgi:hypothetical protein
MYNRISMKKVLLVLVLSVILFLSGCTPMPAGKRYLWIDAKGGVTEVILQGESDSYWKVMYDGGLGAQICYITKNEKNKLEELKKDGDKAQW